MKNSGENTTVLLGKKNTLWSQSLWVEGEKKKEEGEIIKRPGFITLAIWDCANQQRETEAHSSLHRLATEIICATPTALIKRTLKPNTTLRPRSTRKQIMVISVISLISPKSPSDGFSLSFFFFQLLSPLCSFIFQFFNFMYYWNHFPLLLLFLQSWSLKWYLFHLKKNPNPNVSVLWHI